MESCGAITSEDKLGEITETLLKEHGDEAPWQLLALIGEAALAGNESRVQLLIAIAMRLDGMPADQRRPRDSSG